MTEVVTHRDDALGRAVEFAVKWGYLPADYTFADLSAALSNLETRIRELGKERDEAVTLILNVSAQRDDLETRIQELEEALRGYDPHPALKPSPGEEYELVVPVHVILTARAALEEKKK